MSEAKLMEVIAAGGTAKSLAYEALDMYSAGDLARAKELLAKAKAELTRAHQQQAELMFSARAESRGQSQPQTEGQPEPEGLMPALLYMHALDIVMTAMTEHDLIERVIDLFERHRSGDHRAK